MDLLQFQISAYLHFSRILPTKHKPDVLFPCTKCFWFDPVPERAATNDNLSVSLMMRRRRRTMIVMEEPRRTL